MTITTKLVSATVALSALSGVGYATNRFLSSSTLGKALENKGHTLLNFDTEKIDDVSTWTPIINAYNAGNKKFKDLPTITIHSNQVTKNNIDTLKRACTKVINSTKYEEEILLTAEQWCTNPIGIKELVNKERNVLDSTASTNNDEQKWDDKVTDYLKPNAKNKLSSVQISGPITDDNKQTERNKLKQGCEALKDKKTYDRDFHTQLTQFKEWCSNPKKAK